MSNRVSPMRSYNRKAGKTNSIDVGRNNKPLFNSNTLAGLTPS